MWRRIAICAVWCGCSHHGNRGADEPDSTTGAVLVVTSAAFAPNAEVPAAYTCEGADLSPPLAWSGAPATTKRFAIIVDDPDAPDPKAPKQTWVHWVVLVPPTVTSLAAGALPPEAIAGKNDFGKLEWGGPCPPIGRHRYVFKIYALDAEVGAPEITKPELLAAIRRHVLAKGELIGTYEKKSGR